jgi:nitroimidazol reductase NimA-like FMN-containing flavoprotein (pyridoxamine 5'-phosphate oxidase superfamily)
MAEQPLVDEQAIDSYDLAVIPWSRARDLLDAGHAGTHWLGTVRPDGNPHVVPVGAIWLDGAFFFSAGPQSRKARNLAHNPRCVITVALTGLDLVVEGEAAKVTDDAKLRRAAETYASHGWHPTVRDGAFHAEGARVAGPPPYDVYDVIPTKILGFGDDEPFIPTRWLFS